MVSKKHAWVYSAANPSPAAPLNSSNSSPAGMPAFCNLPTFATVINEARLRLNGMFKIEDYPSKIEIESKFDYRITFMPVPDTDFRVQLSDAEVERLKESVGLEITNRINEAVKDTWTRIKDQLQRMKERLSDKDAIFRDSLFENLSDLLSLLPKLNVTNDANIAQVCNDMKALIASPEAVRSDVSLRLQKAKEVDNVLNKFGAFFS